MSLFRELLIKTRETLNSTLEKNKDSPVVEFINKSIDKLNKIVQTIDIILKKKNIDIKKISIEVKDKGKEYLEKGKKYLESTEVKNVIDKAKNIKTNLTSKLTSLFKEENNTGTSPPKETIDISSLKETLITNVKNKFKSVFDKQKEREDKRKQEIEEEKKAILDKNKEKEKKESWLSKILAKIGSLGLFISGAFKTGIGFLLKGIKSFAFPVLKKAAGWLGGFLIKGITKIIPSFASSIASSLQSIIGGIFKHGWNIGKKAIGVFKKGVLATGKALIPTLGKATLGIIASPIGLTLLGAGAIYAGYRYLKYLNKGSIANNIYGKFLKLRLLTYGIDDNKKEYYPKIFDLEMLMKKYIIFENYNITFKQMSNEDKEKILDLFNIKRDNEEEYSIMTNWLQNRFYPAFQAHVKALYNINNSIYFDDLDKLKEYDLFRIISSLVIPSRIYNTTQTPTLPNTNITVTKEEINKLIHDIITELKKKLGDNVKNDKVINLTNLENNRTKNILSLTKEDTIESNKETLGNINKFNILMYTNDFEGEKIIKQLNYSLLSKIIKFRYMLYGFDETKEDSYIKLANIEMLMSNYIKVKNNNVNIKQLDNIVKTKIFDILGISKNDNNKFEILNNWFNNRFLPVFIEFIKALYLINPNVNLTTLNTLKISELLELINNLIIPNKIYSIIFIPNFPDSKVIITDKNINIYKTNLINELKEKVKTENEVINKQNYITVKNNEKYKIPKNPFFTVKDTETEIIQQKNKIDEFNIVTTDSEDGFDKIKSINNSKLKTKVTSKINIAPGNIVPGDMSLTGIVTDLPKEKIYNLDSNVRELFTGMAKEYNSLTGKFIPVSEAFRSYEDQKRLYNKNPGKAARPGTSTHEFGLAIDIDPNTANELEKLGLLRKYGFTRSIGGEKWHLEPIGVSIDPVRAKNDLDFRLTSILSSPGRGGDGYGSLNNSILKKRNIEYQKEIYKKSSDNPIDINKVLKPSTNYNTVSIDNYNTYKNEKVLESPKSIITEPKPTLKLSSSISSNLVTSNMNLNKYANLSPEEAIRQASRMVGIDEEIMLTFAKLESSLNPNAKSKTSSASGLFQITDSTWEELISKYGHKYGLDLTVDKNNSFYNALMASEYAKSNLSKLPEYRSIGLDDITALYLAHHYGISGAKKIINQYKNNPNASIETAVSESAFRANKASLANNSVSSYIHKVSNKIQTAEDTNISSYTRKPTTLAYNTTSGYIKSMSALQPTKVSSVQSTSLSGFDTSSKLIDTINTNAELYKNLAISIESTLNNQLSFLEQIVTILTSINDKIDLNKLKNIISNETTIKYTSNKGISNYSVNLSKEKILA